MNLAKILVSVQVGLAMTLVSVQVNLAKILVSLYRWALPRPLSLYR